MQYLKATVRNKIINSAITEFSQTGYSDASISNIANNAGISLGNIYRYYANKAALFNSLIKPLVDEVTLYLKTGFLPETVSIEEAFAGFIDRVIAYDILFLIIRKSRIESVDRLNDIISDAFSKKIKKEIEMKLTSQDYLVHNNKLFKAITAGYIGVLYGILGDNYKKDKKREYALEVTRFFFENIENRFRLKEKTINE